MSTEHSGSERTGLWSPWYLLYLVPLAMILWVPLYNRIEPRWLGMPFFYWFQLLWVPLSALFTIAIHLRLRR